jgi:hypothetical protein
MPHLREDDGFRICLQAAPARRIGQRAERDEQSSHGFGLKGSGGYGGFGKIRPHIKELRDREIEVLGNFHQARMVLKPANKARSLYKASRLFLLPRRRERC